jgi:hypothetical protein
MGEESNNSNSNSVSRRLRDLMDKTSRHGGIAAAQQAQVQEWFGAPDQGACASRPIPVLVNGGERAPRPGLQCCCSVNIGSCKASTGKSAGCSSLAHAPLIGRLV